jgi:hypothetical protein
VTPARTGSAHAGKFYPVPAKISGCRKIGTALMLKMPTVRPAITCS